MKTKLLFFPMFLGFIVRYYSQKIGAVIINEIYTRLQKLTRIQLSRSLFTKCNISEIQGLLLTNSFEAYRGDYGHSRYNINSRKITKILNIE